MTTSNMTTSKYSLPQSERINSKKQIDRLFRGGGSKAMTAAPLRMVYMADNRQTDSQPADGHQPMAQMMVSVPKRYFKRAVKRNYVKRQQAHSRRPPHRERRQDNVALLHMDSQPSSAYSRGDEPHGQPADTIG